MKKVIRGGSNVRETIFEDEYFDLVKSHGIGINNTPWSGLDVVTKEGPARKHVVEIRLNTKDRGTHLFDGTPVNYEYRDCYIAHGMRSVMDTLDDTREYIKVLQDAVDFAERVNQYLYDNYDIYDHED